ncbi:MAG: hypothetical protein GF329_09915 [Candidatus Lokiarchaeota archaeon]|nr:hypothetical protein [Candidatus Lokiarchaeota archaeon]
MISDLKEDFANFILKNDVIGFFKEPITLKSGRVSYWYVNWRNIAADVYLIDKLTDYIIDYVKKLNLKPDCFFGVPEGATKIGVISQYKWAKQRENYGNKKYVLSMGRGTPKKHGNPKDRYYLGVPKGRVIILEDVTTTGQSLIDIVEKFSELNITIEATISLTNRDEIRPDGISVEEVFKKMNITYYSMSNALDLLPKLYRKNQIDPTIAKKVENYFSAYGVKKLKLLE